MAKKDHVEVQKGYHMGVGPKEMGSRQMSTPMRIMEDLVHHEMRRSYQYPQGMIEPKK